MACTKEEIEKKRLAAVQKRQIKLTHDSTTNKNGVIEQSSAGPFRNSTNTFCNNFHPYSKNTTENKISIEKVVNGSVYLISEEKFEVNPSEYCTPLINIFKSIPSKCFDMKSKLWNFSIDNYDTLMSKVAPLAPHVVLGSIPAYVFKVLKNSTMNPDLVNLSPIEATLRHKLMPFQEDGVRFGISKHGRCMIADDMGLGKTFQALAIASYYKDDWPLLIVTTSSMRNTWQNKIAELLPSVPLANVVALNSGKDAQLAADTQAVVIIVSYKITVMHMELLKRKKFGVAIIDESHHLKSPKAQCTSALSGITKECRRVVLLSGTPALSRPIELFAQLKLIEPRFFSSYTEYGKRYCDGKQTAFGWDMSGQSNLTELQIVLQKRFLIRRTKEQVLVKLEAKTRETVLLDRNLLEYTAEDQRGLSKLAEEYKATKMADRHSALITFFSESARMKIPAICKYIKQQLRNESCGKFLVFAHHKSVIDAICETLDEACVHYICITGSTPTHSRADLVDKFQFTEGCRCAVLSITAANSGLTLTAANLVLFAELHWNPGILTQAESRAHRIGQVGGVRVRYLLAEGTADDHIWPMLQDKLNVLNNVGLSRDTFEDTASTHQESKSSIDQYLISSPKCIKNKNDYIPGTNIRKDLGNIKNEPKTDGEVNGETAEADLEKSFLEDNEGDELLANLDWS